MKLRLRSPITLVLIAAFVLAGAAALWQTWASTPTSAAPGQEGYISTQFGPLSPADRDLIIRVRLAGLWEHPIGQEMADRGVQARVREIGQLISDEHLELDAATIDVARQLGIVLPNQPTPEQQAWLTETTAKTGSDYDWTSVNILRQAHGQILPMLVNVRVSTRNDVVRSFAEQGAVIVQRHINYLESTGLVDFARLDEAPQPPRAVVTRAGQYENVPIALLAVGVVSVCTVGGVVLVRLVQERRRPK